MLKKLTQILIISLAFCFNQAYGVTIEDMVGQKLMVGFHGNSHSRQFKTVLKQIEKGQVGGVIIFKHNFKNKKELLEITNKINNSKATNAAFSKRKPLEPSGIVYARSVRVQSRTGIKL